MDKKRFIINLIVLPTLLRIFGCLRLLMIALLFYIFYCIHKKKRDCTVAVPLLEAFALPTLIEQQREAHADMYAHTSLYIVSMDINIHIPRSSIVAML